MSLYQLSDAATEDLDNIIHYSLNQHGEAQTRKYLAELEQGIEALALSEGVYKNRDDLYPSLRSTLCQHHSIFGLMRTNLPLLVIAIFHERMDLMTQLKRRLR